MLGSYKVILDVPGQGYRKGVVSARINLQFSDVCCPIIMRRNGREKVVFKKLDRIDPLDDPRFTSADVRFGVFDTRRVFSHLLYGQRVTVNHYDTSDKQLWPKLQNDRLFRNAHAFQGSFRRVRRGSGLLSDIDESGNGNNEKPPFGIFPPWLRFGFAVACLWVGCLIAYVKKRMVWSCLGCCFG